ncbi:MAG: sulfatase [Chloroflexota bacterium]
MEAKRLNIIYIVCHDLGRLLGCYNTPLKTPALDQFAAQGVKFNKAFCASPCCSPSRGCSMTGMYAHNNGQIGLSHYGWQLPENQKTIVDFFNEADYETVHVGFQHERHWQKNHYQIDKQTTWDDDKAENAVDAAIKYLKTNANKQKPFYLNVGTQEVHESFFTRNDRLEVYGGPVPDEDVYLPPFVPDTPSLRNYMAKQIAAIKFLDAQLARLFEAIRTYGYDKNSVVVFTTDHGISGMRAKGTLYQAGVETALLMKLPSGMPGGFVVNELINNIDITPTLLEAAGVPVPEQIQGRSFWPMLVGKEYRPHDEIFMEFNFHGVHKTTVLADDKNPYEDKFDPIRSVMTKKFHYIRNFDLTLERKWTHVDQIKLNESDQYNKIWPQLVEPRVLEELYDIEVDPFELKNLSNLNEYTSIKELLSVKLFQWMNDTDDFVLRDEIPQAPGQHGFF